MNGGTAETFIDIEGGRLCFVEQGQGAPIVYLHGQIGSHRWYERVMDVPGAKTVALDMPSFGRSTPLAGVPEIDRYADAVLSFIEKRGLERPVVVGHSFGGSVAMSLGVRFPNRVSGMVLVDSAAPCGLADSPESHPLKEMMRTHREILARPSAPSLRR